MPVKYGHNWSEDTDDAQIECWMIRQPEEWLKQQGRSLFFHHLALQKLLWPKKKWHDWNLLMLEKFCQHQYLAILGPASSGKSHEAVCFALCNYIARPNETAVLVSSTTRDALELRAWAEIKKYWGLARDQYEWIPGTAINSKQRIATDGEEVDDRDFRKGISCVACKTGTTWVGLGPFVGIKQRYVYLLADEGSLMSPAYMEAVSNLSSNEYFWCAVMGNPKDRTDPLGMMAEPHDADGGWEGLDDQLITRWWRTRYPNGIAIQLCGLDSPNMKVPPGTKPPYPFLITRAKIESDVALYGEDSIKVSMMDYGVMPKASASKRIITRSICTKFRAFEDVVWANGNQTRILGLDAAYGGVGGDRCVACQVNFGKSNNGDLVLSYIGEPILVPVSVRKQQEPTDQIATFVKGECERRGIPPENVFYDSTGKGELGIAFGRLWSTAVNPVEFGGAPSNRAAGFFLDKDGKKVAKTCDQEFDKMVSELWWATRWVIESGQLRNLPESVAVEGFMKQWDLKSQGTRTKTSVEPKEDTKERLGRSPDLYDAFVVAVEGARRLGFQIKKLVGVATTKQSTMQDFLDAKRKKHKELQKKQQLNYA